MRVLIDCACRDPLHDSPDPSCEECGGEGVVEVSDSADDRDDEKAALADYEWERMKDRRLGL